MYKADVLDYVSQSKLCTDGVRNGAARMVANILDISDVAVCNWKAVIPASRAMQLDRLFREPEVIKKYALPRKGAPKFVIEIYE